MSKISASKNNWALFLLILAGIVIGGFISELTAGVSWLSWLGYGQTFGIDSASPLVLNLGVMVLTFGLTIRITIGSIVGIILAILIYRLL